VPAHRRAAQLDLEHSHRAVLPVAEAAKRIIALAEKMSRLGIERIEVKEDYARVFCLDRCCTHASLMLI